MLSSNYQNSPLPKFENRVEIKFCFPRDIYVVKQNAIGVKFVQLGEQSEQPPFGLVLPLRQLVNHASRPLVKTVHW